MVIDFSPFYEVHRLLDHFVDDTPARQLYSQRKAAHPPLNISEDDEHVFVRCEVPGVGIEDLDISLVDSSLTIKGERKRIDGKYYRNERAHGAFQRVLTVNGPIDKDKVSASLKDGVLEVRMPKAEAFKPRKIAIS